MLSDTHTLLSDAEHALEEMKNHTKTFDTTLAKLAESDEAHPPVTDDTDADTEMTELEKTLDTELNDAAVELATKSEK